MSGKVSESFSVAAAAGWREGTRSGATRRRARTVVIFLKLYCMVVILKEVRAANAVSFQMGRSDDRLARRVSEVQMQVGAVF